MAKTVLITGGCAGIGRAAAFAFGAAGYSVFLLDLERAQIEETLLDLRTAGFDADGLAGSVADTMDIAAAFEANDERFGGLDVLVNCAGVTGNLAADTIDLEAWNRVVAINQTGTFFCAQAAGRRMMQSGGGSIINLSSIYGLVAAPNRVAYSATKAAVIMMTKALAVEWAQYGVRVNCVAPGYVETPGTMSLVEAGKIDLDALRRRTPQGRLAQPEDIARSILLLCDSGLEHVTGQVLAVDGGWSSYGYL
ncbi:MAG: SDR family NAD(P)-dependent oxidoreductase [Betaproteobacteria bacterium]